jgi:hypothetical protein
VARLRIGRPLHCRRARTCQAAAKAQPRAGLQRLCLSCLRVRLPPLPTLRLASAHAHHAGAKHCTLYQRGCHLSHTLAIPGKLLCMQAATRRGTVAPGMSCPRSTALAHRRFPTTG